MRKIFFKKDWQDIKNTFLENEEVILNDKTKAIRVVITNEKYNPLLSNILYKQNIVSIVKSIRINKIISSIWPPSYS